MAGAFGTAASALAVVELSVKVASLCLQYSKDVTHAREDIERVYKEVCNLKAASEAVDKLLKGANGKELEAARQLLTPLQDSLSRLQELESKLSLGKGRRVMNRLGLRALRWPFERKDVEQAIQDLVRCTQTISLSLQIDQATTILDIRQTLVLDKLPVVIDAAFDSHAEEYNSTCLPDTRVELLRGIYEWANNSQSKSIFWLNGAAGTGKSTISRTVSQKFSADGRLGASFFFKRGEGDRGLAAKFFTTVAAQLAEMEPILAPYIKNVIDADPAIIGKSLREQFKRLILQPLANVSGGIWKAGNFIIVIDALDECEEEDAKTIISLFSSTNGQFPRLRIFITSRPDLPIQLGFGAVQGTYQDLILHEIPEQIVEHDLSMYFNHELANIRDNYNRSVPRDRQLPSNWPEASKTQILVNMAIPLFIFAATVCRFLADRKGGNPDQQLQTVLEYRTRSQESKLDATYLPVLNRMLNGRSEREKIKDMKDFRDIVGTIVILASPLSISALARLLEKTPDVIDSRLDWLHSVLSVPSSRDLPVRLLHLSFRDFLLDPEKAEQGSVIFWVNEQEIHKQVAESCFRVMDEILRKDICEIKWPGTPNSDIDNRVISDRLAPECQYACLYWVYHVQQAGDCISGDQVYRFLQRHFLHWLEALSLIGRASESIRDLRVLKSLSQADPGRCIELSHFVDDALRFARMNVSSIQVTPLQVYCSALIFTPKSVVRNTFQSDMPGWISLGPQVSTHWSHCLQMIEGHGSVVTSVAFSPPNGRVIASGHGDNTVQLWSADTGDKLQMLAGHTEAVTCVAFSPNGRTITSGSQDSTVRLWSADTGVLLQTLKGHTDGVNSVAMNDKFAVSGSYDNTVRLWSVDSGMLLQTLKGHTGGISSVALHGGTIASGSSDSMVRLWSTDTGKHLQTLKGHVGVVTSVAFSPNGGIVVSGSDDLTLRIWSVETGEHSQTLECHASVVTSLAFSPSGSIIVSGSTDRLIRLWSAETGEHLQTLEGHTNIVLSVAFSPDGKTIVSGSGDASIRLWSAEASEQSEAPECHADRVKSVVFSPSGSTIASTAEDRTIRLWSANTGEHLRKLNGHFAFVTMVVFSPNGRGLASVSDDNTIRLWSVDSGNRLHTFEGHTGPIMSVSFSPNGRIIVSRAYDNTVRLWSADTGEHLQTLKGRAGFATVAAFSPICGLIALASDNDAVQLWSADTGEHLRTLEGHTGFISMIEFSPSGRAVVSAADDGTVRLWSTDTGEHLRTLGHTNTVLQAAFSPDSRVIALASVNRTIRLWSVEAGEHTQTQTLQGHTGYNRSIVFLASDWTISARSNDRTVRLWSFDKGRGLRMRSTERNNFSNESYDLFLPNAGDAGERGPGSWLHHGPVHGQQLGVGVRGAWVTFNGKDLLSLPPDFRPRTCVVFGSTVAIGTRLGMVIIMRFSTERLEELC
ncbi:vegetative incompatibility protein HET-E-1 [Xylaria intraflava]|nr:vegetative incompatibility protein HET-E-1 [Xylaria intraflava]